MVNLEIGKKSQCYLNSKRYLLDCGGRANGRSFRGSAIISTKLVKDKYFRCGIMRYILGDVRKSIYQEVIDRLEMFGLLDKVRIANLDIDYNKNSIKGLGFKTSSGQQKAKMKSLAGFNYIVIEEANETDYESFVQLDDSLRKIGVDIKIVLLFNMPPKNFWINKRFFDLELVATPLSTNKFYKPILKSEWQDKADLIWGDYTGNLDNLAPSTIENFESYGNPNSANFNPDYYYNQILGYIPEVKQGLIYNYTTAQEFPSDIDFVYGLDFGYNDPTALIKTGVKDNLKPKKDLYWEEKIYKSELDCNQIINELEACGVQKNTLRKAGDLIIADSSRPELIAQINQAGYNIIACQKGAGSILAGIQEVQKYNLIIVGKSTNLKYEIDNLSWKITKGQVGDVPEGGLDHGADAGRYSVQFWSRINAPPLADKPITPALPIDAFFHNNQEYNSIF
jgi:phage terminase large subunit